MSKFAEFLRHDQRLVILRVLAELPGYRTNSSMLVTLLANFGHSPTRDQVKTELHWLSEQGLVGIEDIGDVLVATLTERGGDVATGRANVPGVKSQEPDMARKSTVDKLEPEVRSHIEKLMRENRLTLDQLIAELQTKFPADDKPSRSALGRYKISFEQMMGKLREQDAMARLLVAELGENPDERAGQLLVQSVTTLTTHAAFAAQESEQVDIEGVRKLARAAKDIIQARKLSLDERRAVEKDARERMLKEQEQRLEEVRGTDGMSEQLEKRIRGILLGKS